MEITVLVFSFLSISMFIEFFTPGTTLESSKQEPDAAATQFFTLHLDESNGKSSA